MTPDEEIENHYADWLISKATTNGDCIECHLNPNAEKYPKIADNEMSHRFMFRVKKSAVDGQIVMHTCDNPRCINLDHLVLGSYADNNRDCREKGRAVLDGRPRLLSDDDRIRIKALREQKKTLQYIASEFGVSIGTIRNALNGYYYARTK